MRATTVVYVGTSLDGFISREDGGFDWLAPFEDPGAMRRFKSFLASIDAIVLGRNTFLLALGFHPWPYGELPVHVLSTSMKALPEGSPPTCCLYRGGLEKLLEELHSQGLRRAYVDGGATIRSFLEKDLIDELTVAQVPILLGKGRTLFGPVPFDLRFRHVATEALENGAVQSTYIRLRAKA